VSVLAARHQSIRLVGYRQFKEGQTSGGRVRPRVLGRTHIGNARALLLRIAPYPEGGVHGGHFAIVWNLHAAGYVISVHFLSPPARSDVTKLLVTMAEHTTVISRSRR
jgi:hypothetical protein